LQEYIDKNSGCIAPSLCKKWFRQATEAIAFLHSKGVIHSDTRPENFLVHATSDSAEFPDILICDFGGSMCREINIDGGHLPDPGFFNPTQEDVSTPAIDIFSLGSIFYSILTGHWPYSLPGSFMTLDERVIYGQNVDMLFEQKKFPDVGELAGGKIVMNCWTKMYSTAEQMLDSIDKEMLIGDR